MTGAEGGRHRTVPLLVGVVMVLATVLALPSATAAEGDPFISGYVNGVQEGPCVQQVGGCQVGLHQWGEGTVVTVKVYESSAKQSLLHEQSLTFPAGGYAAIDGGGNEPGNHLVVSGGGATVEMTLRTHAAQIDPVTNVLSGVSDPAGHINAAVVSREQFAADDGSGVMACSSTTIAADGSWSIDFDEPTDTPGCDTTTWDFGPGDWVHVALDGVVSGGDIQTTATVPDFTDDDGSTFEDEIGWLANQGITRGCNPPTNDEFCPDDFVTRGQMSAFLVRALGYTEALDDPFSDDDGSIFEADIEKLAAAGVTRGCNPPTNDEFCPDDFVTRGQMSAFLYRALG